MHHVICILQNHILLKFPRAWDTGNVLLLPMREGPCVGRELIYFREDGMKMGVDISR